MNNTHEWCAPYAVSQMSYLQNLPLDSFPWITEKLQRMEVVYVPQIPSLSQIILSPEQKAKATGTKSMVAVPMIYGRSPIGFIGFDSTTKEQKWSEEHIALLRLVSHILAQTLEHKQAQLALRQQHSFLQQVIDINPHFIFAKNQQGHFTLVNQAFATAYHTTVEELLNKTDADFNPNPEMVKKYTQDDMFVLRTGKDVVIPEEKIINVMGESYWRHTIKRPILDENKKVQQILGVITDITERKQAEEALAQARDQALEASRLKSQLLAKVSHELRTPLNAILGFTEMLEFGVYGQLTKEQRTGTSEIIDSTKYLTRLVNELLDQAQLDAGKLPLNIARFNPIELIAQVQSSMKVLAQEKNLPLTITIDDTLPQELYGDFNKLQQILINLVGNAIKFTQQGHIQVQINSPDANHWSIQVIDTGPGIPPQAQSRIFEPFQQVDDSITRQHGGSGLGLSIVKQLTTLMGGRISLASELNKGSTFTILLPTHISGD